MDVKHVAQLRKFTGMDKDLLFNPGISGMRGNSSRPT
ncbi:hypothetical protein AB7M31_003421 [Pseudomonas sp. IAP-CY TE4608]